MTDDLAGQDDRYTASLLMAKEEEIVAQQMRRPLPSEEANGESKGMIG
jgi:hypothetical protein